MNLTSMLCGTCVILDGLGLGMLGSVSFLLSASKPSPPWPWSYLSVIPIVTCLTYVCSELGLWQENWLKVLHTPRNVLRTRLLVAVWLFEQWR